MHRAKATTVKTTPKKAVQAQRKCALHEALLQGVPFPTSHSKAALVPSDTLLEAGSASQPFTILLLTLTTAGCTLPELGCDVLLLFPQITSSPLSVRDTPRLSPVLEKLVCPIINIQVVVPAHSHSCSSYPTSTRGMGESSCRARAGQNLKVHLCAGTEPRRPRTGLFCPYSLEEGHR